MKIEKLEFEDKKRIERLNKEFYEKLEKEKDKPSIVVWEDVNNIDLNIRNLDYKEVDGILKYLRNIMPNIKITKHKFNL